MTSDDIVTTKPPPLAPDPSELLGFGTSEPAFVSHNPHSENVELSGQIVEAEQGFAEGTPSPEGHKARIRIHTTVSHRHRPAPCKASTAPRGRGRPARRMEGPITPVQMRELRDARDFAVDIGRPLLCPVDVNPWRLANPPDGDVGQWLRDGPLRLAAQFMGRQKGRFGQPVGWHAVAMRENYSSGDGINREHAHLVCSCPRCLRPKLAKVLNAAFPSAPGERAFVVHGDDLDADGWAYRVKQMTARAAGPPGPRRPTPETKHRDEGWPVAPVLGRRIFVSRSIAKPERTRRGWQATRDEARAVAKVDGAARRARFRSPHPQVIPSTGTIQPMSIP